MASPTQQKKREFEDITDLAKNLIKYEKLHGNEIKLNSTLIKKMSTERQKILNMDLKRNDAGRI